MFLYRISCLGHNCLWLNYELRNRTQIYFLLKACLLVRLWSSHIASTHFVSLPIHKEVITVLIPQLYLEVYFRGFLCQKKKNSIFTSLKLYHDTFWYAFNSPIHSWKYVSQVCTREKWKLKKIQNHNTYHAHMKHNLILFYSLPTLYLSLIIFPFPKDRIFCILSLWCSRHSLQPTKIQGRL